MGKTIHLTDDQAALVLDETGFHELYIPNQDDDDIVPDYVSFLTIISLLLKKNDENFQKYMAKRWNEIVEEYT